MTSAEVDHEAAAARVAAKFQSVWLRNYVASKLRSDPIFAAAHEIFARSPLPLLDVGSGVGLLPFYLRERGFNPRVVGVDRDRRKIKKAMETSTGSDSDLAFIEQDAQSELPALAGNVALIDVLHYLPIEAQRELLVRCAERVAPGGAAVIRDCPQAPGLRFRLTHFAEIFAQAITWNIKTQLHFPTRESICAAFPAAAFSSEIRPLWGRTPFNNHLFVFRRLSI